MRVEVVLPGVLVEDGAARSVALELPDAPGGARVRDVLDALDAALPRTGRSIRDEAGQVRRHVNVFVGQDEMRGLLGLDTPVQEGSSILVLPNIAGG